MRKFVSTMLLGAAVFGVACSDHKASASPEKAAPAGADKAASPPTGAAAQPAANEAPVELPGIDLSGFLESEKRAFYRLVQKYPSACGKAHSLAVSVKTDPGCKKSVFAVRYIHKLLKAHLLESETEEQFEARYQNSKKIDVDISNAPMKGTAGAPIQIVEFSDFRCPHCMRAQPEIERVLTEYAGQVRIYFKNFPLTHAHPDSPLAAASALAAGKQGKFWQFHDRLFSGKDGEGPAAMDKIAKDLKLDLAKWKTDIEAMKPQVDKDRADGEKAEVMSTPTFIINGKKYVGPPRFEEFKEWIEELLNG